MWGLDELLLPIGEILVFRAFLTSHDGVDHLRILAKTEASSLRGLIENVQEALSTIAVVCDAVREEALRVDVAAAKEAAMATRGAGKRTIIDLRGVNSCG